MGIYSAIMTAAKPKLAAIAAAKEVPRLTLRKRPSFEGLIDQMRQIVYATDPNLSERVLELQFGNGCFLEFDLYVGFIVTAEWDEKTLLFRLDLREAIRLALWRDDLITLDDPDREFRCDYEPAPAVTPSGWPNSDESWQLFTFRVSTTQHGS